MTAREYDVIVIGAGAVGENVADAAVQGGMSTLIVEAELVGGECSYWACMPSKALLRPASALRAAHDVGGAREAVTGGVDPSAAFARRDRIAHGWDDSAQVRWLDKTGIALLRGLARFDGPRQIVVAGDDGAETPVSARHAVAICTGSAALLPDIPGLADIAPWTSRDATSARTAPRSLAILGAGLVATEMAAAYASFGTEVTVIGRSGVLRGQEPFAVELVTESLRRSGVTVRTGTEVLSARRTPAGATLELSAGDPVTAEEVLVATGRIARTGDLGLETLALPTGDWLDVDDTLRVRGFDWLYAVGDVNHRALSTHQGKYQARAAGAAIAARAAGIPVDDTPWSAYAATADHSAVPQVVFTDPEIATVGLTADAATAAGRSIRILDYDLSWIGGATTRADDYRGHARAIVDEDRGVLIGATFAGPDVAELLHAATIAIVGEVPLERLWHAVPAYPTVSEVWLRWLEEYRGTGT
ncbi:dihydrolipoyl dehydrogenase family protein [Microbacterium thalassium]|uniref:Dihydrolipoamide dehydrogenase n=1 Tax=Microbacterium thalassium TaxID=362649 RepID=A0A7X0KUH6_9MICO|nr:NAD(P)/FAD-dependent oxidoreductase [Microbacterium thalassium]MBB6391186.1 dihydrolipoamide dehydrogenase [Microbacterium thalassium]GLK23703.1 oxidoreductase [Microbacterium thalassium]